MCGPKCVWMVWHTATHSANRDDRQCEIWDPVGWYQDHGQLLVHCCRFNSILFYDPHHAKQKIHSSIYCRALNVEVNCNLSMSYIKGWDSNLEEFWETLLLGVMFHMSVNRKCYFTARMSSCNSAVIFWNITKSY